jgi:DNA replication licensing factor MCM2
VLCVVRDIVDPVQDQRLAEFVVGSHARSHPEGDEEEQQQDASQQQQQPDGTISQDMLRKYITFAKQQYRPTMSQVGAGASADSEKYAATAVLHVSLSYPGIQSYNAV